jgi:ISXO2-like transposase domain
MPASTKRRTCAPTRAASIGRLASNLPVTAPSITPRRNTFAGDASTNAAENFFSILKRGIYGTYQHVSEEHLHRYLAEFDFRHNNRIALGVDDIERTERAIRGIVGKRLTYRTTHRPGA